MRNIYEFQKLIVDSLNTFSAVIKCVWNVGNSTEIPCMMSQDTENYI